MNNFSSVPLQLMVTSDDVRCYKETHYKTASNTCAKSENKESCPPVKFSSPYSAKNVLSQEE